MITKKLTKKGGPVETQRIVAVIPKDLYKFAKVQAVEREVDLKDLIEEALRKHLGFKEGGEQDKR
jgi:hypothetical protein